MSKSDDDSKVENSPDDFLSADLDSLGNDFRELTDKFKRFSIPAKPNTFGERYIFPEDLTKLDIEGLGQWLGRIGAYRGYVTGLLAVYSVKKMMVESMLTLKSTEQRRARDKGKTTQTAVKEEVSLLPDVQELNRRLLRVSANVEFYSHLQYLYQGQIEVLSREISRRREGNFVK